MYGLNIPPSTGVRDRYCLPTEIDLPRHRGTLLFIGLCDMEGSRPSYNLY